MRLKNLSKVILLLTTSLGLYDAQTSRHRVRANPISNKQTSIIADAASRRLPGSNFKTVSVNASYSMTLTGNPTTSRVTSTPTNGNLLSPMPTQDPAGGRTFVFPGNSALTPSFSFATTANASSQAASLLGPDPYVDIRSTGAYGTFSSTKANTNGTSTVTLAVASHFKNGEYVTISNAGSACTLSTPSAPTATPSANAGGAFNTVSGPTGSNSNSYRIVAVSTTGCYSVAGPSGGTTATSTLGPVGSNISSYSVTGGAVIATTASPHSFVAGQMIYVSYNTLSSGQFEGWFTVFSVPDSTHFTYLFPGDTRVSASTSGSSVAPLSCTVTNTVLTSNIATVTCANSFVAQNMPVIISGTTNGGGIFNGSFQTTALSSSSFSFYLAHANVTSASDSGTTTIPNVWGFNVNHITWPAVTNAFKYFIYGRDGGNFNLIGQTMFNAWNDYGFNMESGQTFPAWAPTTAPSSSGNNHLTAQILSGGGTTTLGLSVAAGASLSGVIINSDDGPALIAALNAAKGQQQACAPVLIPNSTGASTFGLNITSFTDTTATNCPSGMILVQGTLNLLDTMKVGGLSVKGTAGSTTNAPSFGVLSNGPSVVAQAFPGFWLPSFSSGAHFENLNLASFGSNGTNGNLQVFNQGLFTTFDYVSWVHQAPGPLSISQIIDTGGGGFVYKFNYNNIDGGYYANTSGGQYLGLAPYGSMIMTGFGSSNSGAGLLQVSHTWFENKGGFDFEQTNPQGGSTFLFKDISTESHAYPAIVFSGPNLSQVSILNMLDIDGAFVADTPTALVSVLANGFLKNASIRSVPGSPGNHPWNTGAPFIGLSQTSVTSGSQQLFGEEHFGSNFILDGQFNSTQPGPMGVKRFSEIVTVPSMFSLTSTVPAKTAPTCSVSSGGSIPIGSYNFTTTTVWWNGAEGNQSPQSPTCTTTTGNQTITVNWSLVSGVNGYNVYECQGGMNCTAVKSFAPPQFSGTTTSVVLTGFGGTTIPSTVAVGGPTTISGTFVGTQTLQLGSTNSGGVLVVNVPSLTANRTVTLPDASGAVVLSAGTFINGNLVKSDANGNNVDSGIAVSSVLTLSGSACSNGELALSAGWGTRATVTAAVGIGLACEWTITSSGTGQTSSPTITDTLRTALPSATIVCTMQMVGGTGTATLIDQATLSATAPVFTFGGTPVAAATYKVVRRCGP